MADPANPYFRWSSGGLSGVMNAGMLTTDGFAYEGGDLSFTGPIPAHSISFGVGLATESGRSVEISRAQAEVGSRAGKFLVRR